MTIVSLIPASVSQLFKQSEASHGDLWFANSSDISLDGQIQQEWIVVTSQRIAVYSDHRSDASPESITIEKSVDCQPLDSNAASSNSPIQGPICLRSVDWSQVKEVRTQAGVGGGTLQICTEDGWFDWMRFSNALATRFHKISRMLERMREDPQGWSESYSTNYQKAHHHEDVSFDAPECPTCGLRLSNKEENCPRCVQKGQILHRVAGLIRPYRRGAILLCLLTMVGVCAELIPPKLQQYLIDHVLADHVGLEQGNGSMPDFKTALLLVVLALAASRVLLSIVGVIKGHLATIIGTGLTSTLRAQMVHKLQSLAIVYYDRHQVGSMVSRVAHDSEAMHGLMHQITGGFLLQIAQLIGVGAMLLWINPKLALYTLIPVPLVFLGTWIFWKRVYPRYYRLWDASSKQITVLSGMLTGIRVVKAFAQEDREYRRFNSASEQLRGWRLWVEKSNAIYSATMGIVFSLGGLIVWYVGGRDVIGKQMTLGELIAFLAYLAMFYAPLGALSSFTSWLTSFLTGSKRVLELLDTPLTVAEASQPTEWKDARGEIRFENVSFGYDRNQPVLKNISFDVRAGEMIGIVGRSGSGKSTMVNLLGRYYDVQEGRILVDGIDLRDLSMHDLRAKLGIVFQESFLFRGTIWRNLSFGRPACSIIEGLNSAKAAGAHDFICRQPLAYETLLGEQGAGLSGGEKQRLSIARTLLYDPTILVLDEATSNIDAEAEKSIQDALQVLVQGRTTIAIAHRLSTLRNADRILVFDQGQLIEQGTHAELLTLDGTYARLVKIQTSVSKDPNVDRLIAASEFKQPDLLATKTSGELSASEGSSNVTVLDATDTNDSSSSEEPNNAPAIRWLQPLETQFSLGQHMRLELRQGEALLSSSVFVFRTFPATRPNEFLSVRGWNEQGEDIELGMIADLNQWPSQDRLLVEQSLARRYLIRKISRVYRAKLQLGYLDLEVQTNLGRETFTMRWTQSQAIDYGENGKLIIDTKENRYVVEDVDSLPLADRERFLELVYW